MTIQPDFATRILLGLILFGLGCDGTVYTGTAARPDNNKPAADGTCPTGRSGCGTGVFAICADLLTDPGHCGACDQACAPGIACAAGTCQQTQCEGSGIPLSGQPTTKAAGGGAPSNGLGIMPNQILADVDGDGRLDRIEWSMVMGICEACPLDLSEFRVSLRQPDGGFAPPVPYKATDVILRVVVADVNSDGAADLYLISWTYTHSTIDPHHVELWLGQKDGRLRPYAAASLTVDAPGGFGSEIALGDLSGDGWPDLVISAPTPAPEDPPKLSVYLSDSTGALHLSQTFQAWSSHTFIRDWNGDGSPDLALVSGALQLLYNRGDGTFEPPVNCALSIGGGSVHAEDLLVEDFNRDGWMDLVTESLFSPPRVGVLQGFGGCGFSAIKYYELPGSSIGFLRAADLNGDGVLEIVSVNPAISTEKDPSGVLITVVKDYLLAVLLGRPDGTFQRPDQAIPLGPNPITAVAIGEVSGDQRPDVVVTSGAVPAQQTSTWENTCR